MNSEWLTKPRSRRELMDSLIKAGGVAAGGAMLGACAQPSAPPAAPRETIDFADPMQSLRAFIKLIGDLDPTVETPSWFGGTLYADVRRDRPLQPLMGVEGFGVLRTEAQDDGSFHLFNRELAFYTDLKTGEYIDTWVNPWTKEECEVKPIHNMTVNAHMIVSEKIGTAIAMDFDGNLMEVPLPLGWNNFGDKLFSNFGVHTMFPNELKPDVWPRESSGPVVRIAEIFQRVADLAQLENPDVTSADYSGVWTRVGPWLPWMRQGQAEGNLVFSTFMTKLNSADELSPKFKARIEERLPEYFVAPPPETWGAKNDSSFSVYAKENEPLPPLTE
ncbi:MAG: DUF1838 family protein [Gammaproteobacteria bacterium]